jgi:hypothetical protein
MSGTIQVSFNNATLTSTTSNISLTTATYALQPASPIALSGTVNFSSMSIYSSTINFNVSSGSSFNASLNFPYALSSTSTQIPTISVTNFSGYVTVTWPTLTGPITAELQSGLPTQLGNLIPNA